MPIVTRVGSRTREAPVDVMVRTRDYRSWKSYDQMTIEEMCAPLSARVTPIASAYALDGHIVSPGVDMGRVKKEEARMAERMRR